jgi:hypothetical protein
MLGVEGHHVDLAGELERGVDVVERADHHLVGDLAGRAARVAIEHDDAIAHAARGDRQHAAELAAAEDADGGAGQQRTLPGSRAHSGSSRTLRVWLAR